MLQIFSQHFIHPMSNPGTPTTTPNSLPAPSLHPDPSTSTASKNSSSRPSSITRKSDEGIVTSYTSKVAAQRTTAGFPGVNWTTTRLWTSTGRTTLLISPQPTPASNDPTSSSRDRPHSHSSPSTKQV